jgi:hypothetical protein
MLQGYARLDGSLQPLRLRLKVPLTYPLLCALLDIVAVSYSTPSTLPLFLACCAAFVLAYAISLRPQEYLKLPRPVPLRYTANSSLSHFVFDGVFYSVCYPALFPPGSPSHFTTLLEFQKNDTRGKGGPKAIAHCSSVPMSYNCLSVLFNFLRRYPPLPNSPLLSGLGSQLSSHVLTPFLHQLADKFGFDRSKVSLHSTIRSGAFSALEDESDAVKLRQGGWGSIAGMLSYTRGSLRHADYVVEKLHDPSLVPIRVTQMTHNTLSHTASAGPSSSSSTAP